MHITRPARRPCWTRAGSAQPPIDFLEVATAEMTHEDGTAKRLPSGGALQRHTPSWSPFDADLPCGGLSHTHTVQASTQAQPEWRSAGSRERGLRASLGPPTFCWLLNAPCQAGLLQHTISVAEKRQSPNLHGTILWL